MFYCLEYREFVNFGWTFLFLYHPCNHLCWFELPQLNIVVIKFGDKINKSSVPFIIRVKIRPKTAANKDID